MVKTLFYLDVEFRVKSTPLPVLGSKSILDIAVKYKDFDFVKDIIAKNDPFLNDEIDKMMIGFAKKQNDEGLKMIEEFAKRGGSIESVDPQGLSLMRIAWTN